MWNRSCDERLTRILSEYREEVPVALRSVATRLAVAAGSGNGEPYQMVSMARALDGSLSKWIQNDRRLNDTAGRLGDSWQARVAELIDQALEVVSLVEQWDATTFRTRSFPRIPWLIVDAVRQQFEELRDREASDVVRSALAQADESFLNLLDHRRDQAGRMQVLSGWGGDIVVTADGIEAFQALSEAIADVATLKAYNGAAKAVLHVIDKMDNCSQQALRHRMKLQHIAAEGLGRLSVNPEAQRRTLDWLEDELRDRAENIVLQSAQGMAG
jgi:hypothetical protein